MKEKIKDSRISEFLIAVIAVLLGICCIATPDTMSALVGKVMGALIIAVGAVMILSRIRDESFRLPAAVLGAVLIAVGMFIFTRPNQVLSLVFVVFGVLLIADGVSELSVSLVMRGLGMLRWQVSLLLSLLSIVFGVICILGAAGLLTINFIFIGVMLLYDGITQIYSLIRVRRGEKGIVDSKIVDEKDL